MPLKKSTLARRIVRWLVDAWWAQSACEMRAIDRLLAPLDRRQPSRSALRRNEAKARR